MFLLGDFREINKQYLLPFPLFQKKTLGVYISYLGLFCMVLFLIQGNFWHFCYLHLETL